MIRAGGVPAPLRQIRFELGGKNYLPPNSLSRASHFSTKRL
jgi:hypothetical protein